MPFNTARKKKSPPQNRKLEALKQPNIPECEDHRTDEQQPRLPSHARALRHAHHVAHCPAQLRARVVERVIHRCHQRRRRPYLLPNRLRNLQHTHIKRQPQSPPPSSIIIKLSFAPSQNNL